MCPRILTSSRYPKDPKITVSVHRVLIIIFKCIVCPIFPCVLPKSISSNQFKKVPLFESTRFHQLTLIYITRINLSKFVKDTIPFTKFISLQYTFRTLTHIRITHIQITGITGPGSHSFLSSGITGPGSHSFLT